LILRAAFERVRAIVSRRFPSARVSRGVPRGASSRRSSRASRPRPRARTPKNTSLYFGSGVTAARGARIAAARASRFDASNIGRRADGDVEI